MAQVQLNLFDNTNLIVKADKKAVMDMAWFYYKADYVQYKTFSTCLAVAWAVKKSEAYRESINNLVRFHTGIKKLPFRLEWIAGKNLESLYKQALNLDFSFLNQNRGGERV
jgi:hypothetical protein